MPVSKGSKGPSGQSEAVKDRQRIEQDVVRREGDGHMSQDLMDVGDDVLMGQDNSLRNLPWF
jgi:hypothetical protein